VIVSLAFMAVVAVIIGRFLYTQNLTAKPWLEQGLDVDTRHDLTIPRAKLGLGIFITFATSLFALSISAYYMRMSFPDWRALSEPQLLWANTGVLILSSVALQWAQISARRDNLAGIRQGMFAGGLFAAMFLVGQYVAWRQMADLGYYAVTNPSYAFYYMLTAFHALHLAGGLVAWYRTTGKLNKDLPIEKLRMSVDLCTVYWHFLLLVWFVLFGLLLFT